jgi:hypothetical protein
MSAVNGWNTMIDVSDMSSGSVSLMHDDNGMRLVLCGDGMSIWMKIVFLNSQSLLCPGVYTESRPSFDSSEGE